MLQYGHADFVFETDDGDSQFFQNLQYLPNHTLSHPGGTSMIFTQYKEGPDILY
jgi:hypothetical protein